MRSAYQEHYGATRKCRRSLGGPDDALFLPVHTNLSTLFIYLFISYIAPKYLDSIAKKIAEIFF